MKRLIKPLVLLGLLTIECTGETTKTSKGKSSENTTKIDSIILSRHKEIIKVDENDCKFKDNTYSALVKYHNTKTRYSATYTLDVVVENCKVVQINFPNDGWLDQDHILATEIDKEGNALVQCDGNKIYNIKIE